MNYPVEYMIGEVPSAEPCAGVDEVDKSKAECRALINQLKRMHGEPPMSARLKIVGNPHDFGTYYTVNCVFVDGDEEAEEYANKLENELPEYWDEAALRELNPDWDDQKIAQEMINR